MKNGESSLKGRGIKIAIGMMFCILIFFAVMLFSINNKLVHFQASMEKRISELEKRQSSIEQSLGFLKNIPPGIEGLQKHGEALKEKMEVIHEALEKFVDELSESFSTEQKEKVKKAVDKFLRLWEAFGEFLEELEAENRERKEGGQGEGSKNEEYAPSISRSRFQAMLDGITLVVAKIRIENSISSEGGKTS